MMRWRAVWLVLGENAKAINSFKSVPLNSQMKVIKNPLNPSAAIAEMVV